MINNKYNSNNNLGLASYNALWNFPSKKTKIHNWKKSPPFIAKLKNVINQKKNVIVIVIVMVMVKVMDKVMVRVKLMVFGYRYV